MPDSSSSSGTSAGSEKNDGRELETVLFLQLATENDFVRRYVYKPARIALEGN